MMVAHLVLALIMVVQYGTNRYSIVLHVLEVLQPPVLDTDTIYITILFCSPVGFFLCVCMCVYLLVLSHSIGNTTIVLTLEIEINKYVMTFKFDDFQILYQLLIEQYHNCL